MAARGGHDKVVSLLLEAGADKDMKGRFDWTLLHFAARFGRDNVVSLLLEAGANKDIKNSDGAKLSASCFVGDFG